MGRWVWGGATLLVLSCAPPTTVAGATGVPPCSPTELTGTARWQGATGSLAGGISLVNTGSTACALPGSARVQLVDARGQVLPVTERQASDLCQAPQNTTGCQPQATVVVQSGQQATLRFVWQNWCGQMPIGPIALDVSLPAQSRPFSVPVVDAAGIPSVAAPRCVAPDSPSTLALGPVE